MRDGVKTDGIEEPLRLREIEVACRDGLHAGLRAIELLLQPKSRAALPGVLGQDRMARRLVVKSALGRIAGSAVEACAQQTRALCGI
jgi:hypothetical protein